VLGVGAVHSIKSKLIKINIKSRLIGANNSENKKKTTQKKYFRNLKRELTTKDCS